MRVVFLDVGTLAWPHFDPTVFERAIDAHWVFFEQTLPETCLVRCQSAEVIITNKVRLSSDFIQQLPQLRLIVCAATGVDHIDCQAAKAQGVAVCHAQNYSAQAVAQHVWSLILAANQHLMDYQDWVREGHWAKHPFFCGNRYDIPALSDQTLGIIGYGHIGQQVTQVAKAFGMRVIIAKRDEDDSRPGRVALKAFLSQSDIVSCHCPLTSKTQHLMNQTTLSWMKPGSILINCARGGLVDIEALYQALSFNLRAAALDVWPIEPPLLSDTRLGRAPKNLIITPHVAWANQKSRQNLVTQIINMIHSYQIGQLIQEVQ